jgi:hypothetical protein
MHRKPSFFKETSVAKITVRNLLRYFENEMIITSLASSMFFIFILQLLSFVHARQCRMILHIEIRTKAKDRYIS